MWGSAAECHLQLLERQVYSVAMLCQNQSFLSLHHQRRVAGLNMLYKANSNYNHCSPTSTRVRHTRATAAVHPLEFEVSRCRTSQFAKVFPAGFNDLQYSFWHLKAGLVQECSQPLAASLSCVFQFYVAQVLAGLRKQFINNFVFPTRACSGFNNNTNNMNFNDNKFELLRYGKEQEIKSATTY